MLREAKDMIGFTIQATDGDIGHVHDLYFDDEAWVIRYLVVGTGNWLWNRKVLISPLAIGTPDWNSDTFPTRLTREQVRHSPSIDADKPVSRQHELQFSRYYGYPFYWGGTGLWGAQYYPGAMLTGVGYNGTGAEYLAAQVEQEREAREASLLSNDDPHLRSCKEVSGYHIDSLDGEVGHVQGMLIDADSWAIRYLIVNTGNWWPGYQVLVAPDWIKEVSWSERQVRVDMTRKAIQDAPAYDPNLLPDRQQESLVYKHHGRDGYWQHEVPLATAPRSDAVNPGEARASR